MDHSLKDRIAGHGLAAVFILLAVTLLIAERVPQILIFLAVLLASPAAQWDRLRGLEGWRFPAAALGGLMAWMLLSSLWAIDGAESFERGLRVALTIAAAAGLPVIVLLLPRGVQAMAMRGAWIAAVLLLVLLLIETVFDMPILRAFRLLAHGEVFTSAPPPAGGDGLVRLSPGYLVNRLTYASVGSAILAIPLAALAWRRGLLAVSATVIGAAAAGLWLAPTVSPFAALVTALVLSPLGLAGRTPGTVVPAAAAAACLLAPVAAPWIGNVLAGVTSDASLLHRFAIWDFSSGLVAAKPVFGHGMEAARMIGREGGNLGAVVADWPVEFAAMPLHPHNASIQVWLELGTVGAAMFAAFLFGVARAIWHSLDDVMARAGLAGGFFAALAIAHLSFGIWQFWWLATLGLTAAMAVLLVRGEAAP